MTINIMLFNIIEDWLRSIGYYTSTYCSRYKYEPQMKAWIVRLRDDKFGFVTYFYSDCIEFSDGHNYIALYYASPDFFKQFNDRIDYVFRND